MSRPQLWTWEISVSEQPAPRCESHESVPRLTETFLEEVECHDYTTNQHNCLFLWQLALFAEFDGRLIRVLTAFSKQTGLRCVKMRFPVTQLSSMFFTGYPWGFLSFLFFLNADNFKRNLPTWLLVQDTHVEHEEAKQESVSSLHPGFNWAVFIVLI